MVDFQSSGRQHRVYDLGPPGRWVHVKDHFLIEQSSKTRIKRGKERGAKNGGGHGRMNAYRHWGVGRHHHGLEATLVDHAGGEHTAQGH